jgi:penicillin amidase
MGYDGTVPVSFLTEGVVWEGLKNPDAYPKVVNPSSGKVWTANNWMIGGKWEEIVGTAGFRNGIRAYQISQKLDELSNASAQEMLELQLDTSAEFFSRWQQLLIEILSSKNEISQEKQELLRLVSNWEGSSSADSASYFWIRSFREAVTDRVLHRFLYPCYKVWDQFSHHLFDFEEPVWILVSEQPDYLKDPLLGSWENELMAAVDDLLGANFATVASMKSETWGKHNKLLIEHPMSKSIPILGKYLNMPQTEVSGDLYVPCVLRPRAGASQRMVVSPGLEKDGIFQSPCGQSGHPLSSHYRDLHQDWLDGNPTPFLPSSTVETLVLFPK